MGSRVGRVWPGGAGPAPMAGLTWRIPVRIPRRNKCYGVGVLTRPLIVPPPQTHHEAGVNAPNRNLFKIPPPCTAGAGPPGGGRRSHWGWRSRKERRGRDRRNRLVGGGLRPGRVKGRGKPVRYITNSASPNGKTPFGDRKLYSGESFDLCHE